MLGSINLADRATRSAKCLPMQDVRLSLDNEEIVGNSSITEVSWRVLDVSKVLPRNKPV